MVKNASRTIYGTHLQLCEMMGYPYNVKANTTLNEKFGIGTEIGLSKGQYPTLQYLVIGNGDSSLIDNATGYSFNTHSAVDAALFNHIPFVIREKYDDIDVEQRLRYRLRKLQVINNVEYYCYYAKKIEEVKYKDSFFKVVKLGQNDILSLLNPNDEAFLTPKPKSKLEIINNVDDTKYIAMLCKIYFNMTEDDIKELKHVYKILGIDTPKVTELGLCTGIDVEEDGWAEAGVVQIAYHVGVNLDLTINFEKESKLSRSVEIGGSEPYYLGVQ